MPVRGGPEDANCAVAQALGVVGDAWTLLVVRDVARGAHRFEDLRFFFFFFFLVLAERLRLLTGAEVLERVPYQEHPPRHAYRLTARGRALLPVLLALQDWGDTWVLGEGETRATADADSREAERVHALRGTALPRLWLPDATGAPRDPVADDAAFTVLYFFPGAFADPAAYPPGWAEIPGARGCTLESCTYREEWPAFRDRGAAVRGVSTQRPDEQRAFAAKERLPFPLLSDAAGELAAALRLPVFTTAGTRRLKRLTLLVDGDRVVREVWYPVPDVVASVTAALAAVERERSRREAGQQG
ncbi:winged helix-turn-helix transcriptional regulator [Streptomyces sp. SPB074]|uniref:winged helix-turn-helix transcriptional regulator n=1 Tax=Streptomyces sp. (strain SPB074) TaxID=465543 RepID=UPI0001D1DD02|nr:winged helix-turn-helix transcriptional regulator [Streptomyces sp. SPB074]EDY43771.2 transcriptional regulator [Streptomyces sp. SPB074]